MRGGEGSQTMWNIFLFLVERKNFPNNGGGFELCETFSFFVVWKEKFPKVLGEGFYGNMEKLHRPGFAGLCILPGLKFSLFNQMSNEMFKSPGYQALI